MDASKAEKVYVGVVEDIVGRTGSRGGITQVRVTIKLPGGKDRMIYRNIKGPVRKGDQIVLMEVEREAKRISKKGGRKVAKN